MKQIVFIILCLLSCSLTHAQKGTKEVYYGNQAYRKGDLKAAVQYYEKALKTAPENEAARINLAIAQSKLKVTDKSVANFDKALKESKGNEALQSRLNYDKGTALAKGKKYKEAIDAFKNTLRINPGDAEARDNLQKAINELKQQQKKNKTQDKQNKDKKDKKKQQDKKEQQKKDQQQKNKEQQNKMTKEQADKLLKALHRQEKETQKKLQKKAGTAPPQNGMDW